jgi:hypothetical protein
LLLAGVDPISERCRSTAARYFSLDQVGRPGYLRVYGQLGWVSGANDVLHAGGR